MFYKHFFQIKHNFSLFCNILVQSRSSFHARHLHSSTVQLLNLKYPNAVARLKTKTINRINTAGNKRKLQNVSDKSHQSIGNQELTLKGLLEFNGADIKMKVEKRNLTKQKNEYFCSHNHISLNQGLVDYNKNKVNARNYSTSSQSNEVDKTLEYTEDNETKKVLKLFPQPKHVLNNVCTLLAKKQKKFTNPSPIYKVIKSNGGSKWQCMYHLRYPEDVRFLAEGGTKKDASHKASLLALKYFYLNKIINESGTLVIDKQEVKEIKKKIPSLELDRSSLEGLKNISNIYKEELMDRVVQYLNETDQGQERKVTSEEVNYYGRQRFLNVKRYKTKEKVKLPIADFKEQFLELLDNHNVVIVKGEPGCGKSTRVPQYVLESWARSPLASTTPCRIAVTQPRRIAAISLAERVSHERDESTGDIFGYQVRLRSNFRPHTGRVLFCTTGILLRHLQTDQTLTNFTHVILDEAHERDVNTDLLMNLLRNALQLNPSLKLIIMSATIDTACFQSYFPNTALLEVPGFTYPVKQFFLDTCSLDLSKTLKMCSEEVATVCHEDVIRVIDYIHKHRPEGAILCFLPGWDDISRISKQISDRNNMAVYCLHSRLQDSEQYKIFSKPPPGIRKVILATNIAETSVTIDDVVYVIDTGIHKEAIFDSTKGVSCIDNRWVSKSSVTQRKGRAGRVQPGESFHLYTKEKYQSFDDYSLPEIMRTSLTKIVLDAKVYTNNLPAEEFMSNLLTPPKSNDISQAVKELKDLELLDEEEKLTSLGRTLADFQLEPKLGKAMVNAVIFKCVTPIVDIATLFSAESELFVTGLLDKEGVKEVKSSYSKDSDHLAMMRLFEQWLETKEEGGRTDHFCLEKNLVGHKMEAIEKLREIHFNYLYKGLYEVLDIEDDFSNNDELVKAVLFSGVTTVLQHRNWDIVKNTIKPNSNVLLTRHNQKATISSESVNFKRNKYPSKFLVYINETRSNIRRMTLVRETSLLSPLSVLLFSNKQLILKQIEKDLFDPKLKSSDQVVLYLEGTNIQIICDRIQAEAVLECKKSLRRCYDYFIYQLTRGGETNEDINGIWQKILERLDRVLLQSAPQC